MTLFAQVFEIVKTIEYENLKGCESLICLILSKIYPIIFTSAILQGEIAEIEAFTKAFMKGDYKKNSLEYLRLMQIVLLVKSVYYNEEDEGEEEEVDIFINSEKLGISLIEKDPRMKEIFTEFKEEGSVLFNQFLRIQRDLKPSLLTGWINLLHPIVKTRPAFYPSLIPTLLSFTEPKWTESFSLIQKRNVLHTLKAELTTLVSVPKAEKFYSLIMDSLDKCNVASTAVTASNKKASQMQVDSIPAEVEEEERELAASLGGIQERFGQRPSGAFAETSANTGTKAVASTTLEYESLASEALSKELIKIPSPMVNEMIVRMLGSWTFEQIKPVVLNRWNKINVAVEESVDLTTSVNNLKKTTEEAFTLEASQLTAELPGEIIHLSVSRILQSITDLSEFHASSRRDDLIPSLEDENDNGNSSGDSVTLDGSKVIGNVSRGIPIPLIPLCRIIALVAAHVGHVRSDILMDPEERRKKLDRQFDPRFRKKKSVEKDKDIFGSSDSDDDDNVKMEVDIEGEVSGEFDKTVNQIVLGWINEDLPGRFDFVWYWLEAVWVHEGKSGIILDSHDGATSDYDKLFDDVIGIVGEYFISEDDEEEGLEVPVPPGSLERVLKVLLKVPKLNASFIRNLLYPLMGESRYRRVALQSLAKLLLQRPALRAMLTDFVMTLAESEDEALRKDTIEILLLKGGLYPDLRSLSSQLEAYSLDLMDDLTAKQQAAEEDEESSMKKLKLESKENVGIVEIAESQAAAEQVQEDFSDFEANTGLFLGLLKRNPERLLPPLLVRFPRFGVKLQAFLLDRSLPQVVQNWSPKELSGLLKTLKNEQKVDEGGIVGELVIQIVKLVLSSAGSLSTEAESVAFYSEFVDLVQMKIASGTWDGRLIPDLIPWILKDRSDLPDFFNIYLPKFISISPSGFLSASNRICSSGGGQLISPTHLFVQIHLLPSSSVPLKNLIEVLQLIFNQCKSSSAAMAANANAKDQSLFNVAVISTGLGQLVDQTPLPALLGRSLLQSIPLLNQSTPLNASFLLSLLARLIPRKIWEAGKLWEGWIRCCRALLPGSMSVLLQLPTVQLEKLLKEGGSDLKTPLREYLYNQPPSVRNRYTSILSAIEK